MIVTHHPRSARSSRGSALVMAVILSVVVTAVVMVVAWTSTTIVQGTRNYCRQTRAFYVAEGASQRAFWRYKHDSTWRADPSGSPATSALTGSDTVDGLTYQYSVTCSGASGSPVLVTSTTASGDVQSQVHMTLTAGTGAAGVLVGGTMSSTNQLTMTGDVVSVGKITTSGTFSVTGNLRTGSTFGGGTVTGTVTTNDSSVNNSVIPNVNSIFNSLKASGYTVTAGTITSLDFAAHPIIYADGDVKLGSGLTVNGVGTLVANGKVTTGGDVGTAASPKTFNIVAKGDFSATNKVYLNGGVYSGGTISFTNITVVTGTLVATGSLTMNNKHTITYTTPPSFDPRGSTTISSFGGPLP